MSRAANKQKSRRKKRQGMKPNRAWVVVDRDGNAAYIWAPDETTAQRQFLNQRGRA